jgi:hypothetical protein
VVLPELEKLMAPSPLSFASLAQQQEIWKIKQGNKIEEMLPSLPNQHRLSQELRERKTHMCYMP